MKKISLNGLWKCKPDFNDIGIIEEWFDDKFYLQTQESLFDLEIPNSFNLISEYENFEGIFWHFYSFDVNDLAEGLYFYIIEMKGINNDYYYKKVRTMLLVK